MSPAADDFDDLDAIIAEAESRKRDKQTITGKLATPGLSLEERQRMEAELRAHDAIATWTTVAAVALFDTQTCSSCGHSHRFFKGWMTAQNHRTDPHCRRLVAGRPSNRSLPARIEEHSHGAVEMCDDCAESCIILDIFLESR